MRLVQPVQRDCNADRARRGTNSGVRLKSLIRPGQEPSFFWTVYNSCSDLGLVSAKVSFNGHVVYTSQAIAVGPHSSGGLAQQSISKSDVLNNGIEKSFWQIGRHILTLEIIVTGSSVAPAPVTADMEVIPETVDASWWVWSVTSTGVSGSATSPFVERWRRSYTVSGTLTNRTNLSIITPTIVNFNEHPSTSIDSANDVSVPITSFLQPLDPSFTDRVLLISSPILKNWQWFDQTSFAFTGPSFTDFLYTLVFTMVDEFGNEYAGIASLPATVRVEVSSVKAQLQSLPMRSW